MSDERRTTHNSHREVLKRRTAECRPTPRDSWCDRPGRRARHNATTSDERPTFVNNSRVGRAVDQNDGERQRALITRLQILITIERRRQQLIDLADLAGGRAIGTAAAAAEAIKQSDTATTITPTANDQ